MVFPVRFCDLALYVDAGAVNTFSTDGPIQLRLSDGTLISRKIDADNNLMLVRGAVPGPNGGLVMVRPTNKKG